MKAEEKIIMYDSPEAAEIKTVTGWVSSTGRWWAKDEHMARWEGCTHKKCECGTVVEKSRSKCEECHHKYLLDLYNSYPLKEWDGKTPVTTFFNDKFFFDSDEIEEYLDENEMNPEDLYLQLCEPKYMQEIDAGLWNDVLPEDQDDLPKEIQSALDDLNAKLKKQGPVSWSGCKVRINYK